jgi:transposase
VFAGNRADVGTVEQIVRGMEEKYGQAERIWVMDRGMVSEANIGFLRERKARYLVGTPKSWLRAHEQTLLEQSDWKSVQDGLEVRLVEQPGGEPGERYVLCRSGVRAEKERAMFARQSERLTEELIKIDAWLRRAPQADQETVGLRIGRHLGKYPAAAAIVVADVIHDADGRAVALRVSSRLDAGQKAHRQKGAYLLRTNCEETDPALLWKWYIQITQAEAAFRTVKSDLGLRPVFHQKEDRVQAHILVCFLALALWRSLEQWMPGEGPGHLRAPTGQGGGYDQKRGRDPAGAARHSAHRTAPADRATPEPATVQLLAHLGLRLPKGPRIVANVVPKIAP